MKFLRRKSQRDELGSDADPSPTSTPARSMRDPSPNPVAKDLPPPPPLYARYARVTATPSFDSLNNTLESPSASRFSAFNGSTASGFGNPSPSLHSLSTDGANIGSQGRAAGSAFLASRDASPPSTTAKPEPIKLKQRGRRAATDSSGPRVVSMIESRSNTSTPVPPAKPARAWTNGSADAPATSGVGSVPKTSLEGRLYGQDDPPFKSTPGAVSARTQNAPSSVSAALSPSSMQSTDYTNTAASGQTPSITPVAKRSTTAPQTNNRSSVLGSQPTTLQKSILAPETDPADVYSFYNAAVRMVESPISNVPSPSRTREGPPNAINHRQSPKKSTFVIPNSNPPPISLNDSVNNNDADILVKPPSRRESLPQAVRAPTESVKFPTAPVAPVRRSPSPTKSRPQPTQSDFSAFQQPGGMAGVGALGQNIISSTGAISPRPTPAAAAPVVTKPLNPHSLPNTSSTTNGRYTASPSTLTPTPSSEKIAFPKESPIVIPQYSHSIPEKTPLIKSGLNAAPLKPATPSSILASANTTPKVSSIPMPSSAASSVATVRQSRIAAKANAVAAAKVEEPVTSNIQVPAPSPAKPVNAKATPSASASVAPQVQPSSAPSRQSSSTSVASSSGPSATQTRSTATSPSGLNTPEDLPLARTPEPQEVSKIKLTKGGSVINGVKYAIDADITPPATASARPQRVSNTTPGPVATAIQEIQARHEVSEQPKTPSYARHDKPSANGHQENIDHGRHAKIAAQPPTMEREQNHVASRPTNGYESNHNFYSQAAPAAFHDMDVSRGRNSPAMNYARGSRYTPTPEPELDYDPDLIYPIEQHLSNPALLAHLLYFMQFPDMLALSSVSKIIRNMLEDRRELREEVLEWFLGTVGYTRWDFGKKREPLALTLRDLNSYLRGVSIPIHRYAEIAEGQTFAGKESGKSRIVRLLASSTRAYSKVVLRLRAQAEMEAIMAQASPMVTIANPGRSRPTTPLVRAQSPSPATGTWHKVFHSPLYRIGHSPLLRVFVPSPDGAWLSDTSVLACEKELKRAGIVPLLKAGDVIWDTAVSDEAGFGNVGRLIWDGNYLIDLDYTFSTTGDIPPYLHSLSFPPAYFHKVLRSSGNPVMQLDLRPWGREIASNLQLVQDRAQAETPQGGRHTVMRWTHRTRLQVIRNTPIPDTNLLVDAGWEGSIVIEAEGTNEGLADLQLRCGMEWFKPQPGVQPKQGDGGRVFRLMRERSRPGEIWLRTVRMKERIS